MISCISQFGGIPLVALVSSSPNRRPWQYWPVREKLVAKDNSKRNSWENSTRCSLRVPLIRFQPRGGLNCAGVTSDKQKLLHKNWDLPGKLS